MRCLVHMALLWVLAASTFVPAAQPAPKLVNPLLPDPTTLPPQVSGSKEAPNAFVSCPVPPMVMVDVFGVGETVYHPVTRPPFWASSPSTLPLLRAGFYMDSSHSLLNTSAKADNDVAVQPIR